MPPSSLRPDKPQARTVGELGQLIGAELPDPEGRTVKVSGITHDSRQVRPGDLYAAMLGENTHGAAFVKQAAEAGAVAILTDPLGRERSRLAGLPVLVANDARASLGAVAAAVYGEPAAAMLSIGVTGTNGKTTTAFMLESGLRAAGRSTGLFGTVATRIGDEALPSARTTPEAPDLHALLAVMSERGVDAVAMEVSSHALDLHRVDGVVYDAALFTNLSHDHLDFHFTMEAYFQAKAVLFTPAHAKAGVVNLDDAYGKRLTQNRLIPITTFSATGDEAADWRAVAVKLGPAGSTFTVQGPKGAGATASIGLPGAFNVANALGAIVALVVAGIPLKAAVEGVAACPGVPGRLEKVDAGQDFLAVVDYAHTPAAIETVLTALRPVTSGKLIVVLGAGGDRDKTKRPLMGEVAARLGDVLILTDDNPRSEDPKEILVAVKAGADGVSKEERAELLVEHDRTKAIALAVAKAEAGDAVVVAGKGHEQGQEAKGEVKPFDDREVLGDALLNAEPGPTGSARGTKK